jgi:hypothetical protein
MRQQLRRDAGTVVEDLKRRFTFALAFLLLRG